MTVSAVEKPGSKIRLKISSSDSDAPALDQSALDRLGQDPFALQAAAVVDDLDDDAAGVVVGVEPDRALRRLAARRRTSADSMPWSMALRTRCVSGSPIFSTTVLSSSVSAPLIDQLDVLAELAADVAHHALEAVEGVADLHHAQLQRAVADVLDQRGTASTIGLDQLRQSCALADHGRLRCRR